jgi:hypothetical protein
MIIIDIQLGLYNVAHLTLKQYLYFQYSIPQRHSRESGNPF